MNKTIVIAAAALLLSACGSKPENSYSVDEKTGETTATVTTDDGGTLSVRSGENVPVKLPKGFKVYPGAKVVSNTTVAHDGGNGALIIMESADSPKDMADYYRAQAESAGIDIKLQLSTDNGQMIAGEGKGGVTFSFNANSDDDADGAKTSAQLMIGTKPGG